MLSTMPSVTEMYVLWLSGLSLRKIANRYNIGRMSVFAMFRRAYGRDACTLRKQSLARVVYQEYGDLSLALKARGVEGLYRTGRVEKNVSRWQTNKLDWLKNHIAKSTPDFDNHCPAPFMYYLYNLSTIQALLSQAIANASGD